MTIAMLRQGLRSLLQNYGNVEVVGEAADGEEAVTLASRPDPSVVVMDINMLKMTGLKPQLVFTTNRLTFRSLGSR